MAQSTHVMELNGRHYDALTGALLMSGPKPMSDISPARPMPPAPTDRRFQTQSKPYTGAVMDIVRAPASHAKPHKVQHSQTLVRTAVQQPGQSLKRHTRATTHTGSLAKAVPFDVVSKHSVSLIDEQRLRRSRTIAKSGLVQRFASSDTAPRSTAYQARTTPAPIARAVATPSAPAHIQPVNHNPMDAFERALTTASTPKPYVPVKKKATRARRFHQITSVAVSTFAALLILGFVAYQNAAVIQLRLASSKAGINATLPAWQPSGFRVGTFAYGPGTVTVKYSSPASGSHFSIVQTASKWDSATLLSEYVYPNNSTYDVITSNGTTIYTYDSSSATWVRGGIWYKLTSDDGLSTSQIVNIATSM
jgi:hypothetical protein